MSNEIVRRVRDIGVRGGSLMDLLAIAFARRPGDVGQSESAILGLVKSIGGINNLSQLSATDIEEIVAFDEFEVLRLQSLIEIGRRSGNARKGPVTDVNNPAEVYEELQDAFSDSRQEHFVVLLLSAKNSILRVVTVHKGTLSSTQVGAREVFREAVREGACSVIVAHNHPSGDPTPSSEDIQVTKRLVEVGILLDIPVLDHIIIGHPSHVPPYTSLRHERLM